MVALPVDRVGVQDAGWQDMRQQLFGQQRQRETEARLIGVLSQVHARLTQATRGKSTTEDVKVRTRALGAVVDGANQLIAWHHEELLSGRTAGRWLQALPDTPREVLADVCDRYPLFESAHVAGLAIDCADVIQSIGSLRGPDGDAFFNDALDGAGAIMRAAFDRIASDAPTASAAAALAETWEALLADVDALAVPVLDAPIASEAPTEPELRIEPLQDVREPLALRPQTTEPPHDLFPLVERPTEAETDAQEPEPERTSPVPPAPETEQVFADLTPILAARFSRIFLVAC